MTKKLLLTLLLSAAGAFVTAGAKDLALLPWPQRVQQLNGTFTLTPKTRICADGPSLKTAAFLAERLRHSTHYPLKTRRRIASAPPPNSILFTTKGANAGLGPEGYELIVGANGIVIRAPTQAGLFYGGQTLLQLFRLPKDRPDLPGVGDPSAGRRADSTAADVTLSNQETTRACSGEDAPQARFTAPCVKITDWPRFHWRGLMLDVSRHFFNKTEVETILDEMARYKLNRFHWHLVDDQGWRIEIKRYPRLTQIGAWRRRADIEPPETNAPAWTRPSPDKFGPDGLYGGFYTQKEIREIVAYAAARHIMVVPEIEMPGHSEAALAAYPQFSCFGGPYSTDCDLSIHDGIYDPSNEKTFQFLDNVLTEVFRLFPGPYVHIGGDEVRRDYWDRSASCRALMKREGFKSQDQLQSYFIRRIERFVNARRRILIGWSEILKGGLATNAVVMDWIGGGRQAAETGHDAIMTPFAYCYLDHYYKPGSPHVYTPMRKVYSLNPMPAGLPARFQSHILGAEGVLWTEYVASLPQAQRVIFPRECAIAEVTWSDSTDWDSFQRRIAAIQ